jgi:hypothetical protein
MHFIGFFIYDRRDNRNDGVRLTTTTVLLSVGNNIDRRDNRRSTGTEVMAGTVGHMNGMTGVLTVAVVVIERVTVVVIIKPGFGMFGNLV